MDNNELAFAEHVKIKCICGEENILIGFREKIVCSCGALLRIEFTDNDVMPYASIPDTHDMYEASLSDSVPGPEVVEFCWGDGVVHGQDQLVRI